MQVRKNKAVGLYSSSTIYKLWAQSSNIRFASRIIRCK
jgi:hypothetical protein